MVNATPGGGGGSRFTVDTNAIFQQSGNIGTLVGDLETKIGLLDRQLGHLQSQWTGSGSAAFNGLCKDWERQQRGMKDTLRRIGLALGKTGNGYDEAEKAARATFTVPS